MRSVSAPAFFARRPGSVPATRSGSAEKLQSPAPQVTHQETASGGEFTIGREAIMTYRKSGPETIVVNHTRVAKGNEGKGLARVLYRQMVEFAREHELRVEPTCSYVVAMFERFPEDRDVLR